jgi:hypothetical protein
MRWTTVPNTSGGRRRLLIVVAAILVALLAGVAVLASSIDPDETETAFSSDEAIGEWTAVDGAGTLSLSGDGSFEIDSLSIDPIRRAAPLGEFYGSGTWQIGAVGSANGALTLNFTAWGNTRLETKPPEVESQLYPIGVLVEDGGVRLYFEDASKESRFLLEK